MSDKFVFSYEDDGSLSLKSAINQALGAASTCWEAPHLAGVFDDKYAMKISDALHGFVVVNPEGIAAPTAAPTSELAEAARKIVQACREAFPGADPQLQQAMCFVEELGEFQGEARRYLGLARRGGNPRAMAEELADVVITAYSVAEVFCVEIDESVVLPSPEMDVEGAVWGLMVAGSYVIRELDFRMVSDSDTDTPRLTVQLNNLVAVTRHVAAVMDVDLNEEIGKKHEKIFQRGWRDSTAILSDESPRPIRIVPGGPVIHMDQSQGGNMYGAGLADGFAAGVRQGGMAME